MENTAVVWENGGFSLRKRGPSARQREEGGGVNARGEKDFERAETAVESFSKKVKSGRDWRDAELIEGKANERSISR